MQFGTWLRAARAAEAEQGVDHYELACYPGKLTLYVRGHLADAVGQLVEVDDAIPDSLTEDQDLRAFWENSRETYILGIREVLDHLGAALAAVGCTDKQLEAVRQQLTQSSGNADRVCAVCKKSGAAAADSFVSDEDDYVCSNEDCQDAYENPETVKLTVAEVEQAIADGVNK